MGDNLPQLPSFQLSLMPFDCVQPPIQLSRNRVELNQMIVSSVESLVDVTSKRIHLLFKTLVIPAQFSIVRPAKNNPSQNHDQWNSDNDNVVHRTLQNRRSI